MTERTQLTLNNFFIYNETFGRKEGEEEDKVMYYFPLRSNPDTIMKSVGLSEAIIKFTETFNTSQPCEVLHTEKTRQYYYQPEENFWMVMTVNVPYRSGIEGREYLGSEVHDSVCHAVLRQAYAMARLFIGPFNDLLTNGDNAKDSTSVIKTKLDNFYNRYLHNMLHLEHCDILDVFQGVQFLPLDKNTFLHVQCFVNQVESTFSANVEFSIFLYNEQLIWSGLEPEDLQVVFRYLVNSLIPSYIENQTSKTVSHSVSSRSFSRFITGPKDLNDIHCSIIKKVPTVYLNRSNTTPDVYQMVVYRVNNATICLFVKNSVLLTMDIYRQFDEYLESRMNKIAKEVAEYNSRQTAASVINEGTSRFVYFNRMNLATKSTVHLDNRKSGNITVTKDVLRILADINTEHWKMVEAGNPTCETIIKTVNDYWIVGRLSNAREFYVITQHKNANIVEINEIHVNILQCKK
ncbi:vacuolar fusion protein CCZ1 isoform X2 [Lycorma delicatula]|uniref:vacuolar fusion protein CCZ1 isoform X2 n=1 Tax=Lycorma delicatula TaxID=130591 RepID=UPI003F518A3F